MHFNKLSAMFLAALPLCVAGCQSGDPTRLLVDARGAAAQERPAWDGPQSGPVAPYKEAQFAYRPPLEVSDGGNYLKLQYDEKKDINDRDEVPVRKVRTWYTSRLPRDAQLEGEYGPRAQKFRAVGALAGGSKMTVIYIHGRGGNRDWGFDDERFGGNFNRLKHLMLRTGGLYISPDFTDFEATGFADVKALIAKARALTTGKLVVACGSLGNAHCWSIAADAKTSAQVDGLLVLAGFPDDRILSSPMLRASRKKPLAIVHGSLDPTFDYRPMEALYRRIRAQAPGFPVRFLLFDTGKHGAPVRMLDWRDTLNWIASF